MGSYQPIRNETYAPQAYWDFTGATPRLFPGEPPGELDNIADPSKILCESEQVLTENGLLLVDA